MINGIILSAGMGKRLGTSAKGSVNLVDRPMIKYVYEEIKDLVSSVRCIVGYKKEDIINILGSDVIYSVQEELNGTGGALISILDNLNNDDYSLITMCDLPLIEKTDYSLLLKDYKNYDVSILTFKSIDKLDYGVYKNGRIYEKDSLETSDIYFSGVMLINNKFLKENILKIKKINGEIYLTSILEYTSNINSILIDEEHALGINDTYALNKASDIIFKNKRKELIDDGVLILGEAFISKSVKIKKGSIIYPGTIILGDTVIDIDNEIGPNSFIKNSSIGKNNKIIDSYVINSQIGSNNEIGPFSHLREGVIVGNYTRIGNYVELKKTSFKDYSKASHLAYLGDSIVEENVNFGCGAITVNFDGKNKHQTFIGKNAFIGSNSNLIAPVNIAKNSIVACGSTITTDVLEGQMGIARAYQVNKKIKNDY